MKPSKVRLSNRRNVLREVVQSNPYKTAKEIRRIIVGDEDISRASKKELTYPEIMRRLNECCVKGDKRECSVLKRDVLTWAAPTVNAPALKAVK